VEGASKSERGSLSGDRVQGRTERNEIVHVEAPRAADLVGEIVEVEVVRANKHSLAAVPVDAPRPQPKAPTVVVSPRRLPLL
jgi:tRNA-2-methylthio-N6-dimethylallyladenosine synthase